MRNDMILLPYGKQTRSLNLCNYSYFVIQPRYHTVQKNETYLVKQAFSSEKFKKLENFFFGKSIGVAINDPTRPVPHSKLLGILIDFLKNNQADPEKICFYIATGTHKPLSKKEIYEYLPEFLWKNYKIYSHNCDNPESLEYLGITKRGTSVFVNKGFWQTDIKIVVGNIEPHHFMGYSGGVKSAAIGLAGRETIRQNHSMLSNPKARMGLYKSNPMRMDVEEIGRMIGVNYALNAVMNNRKEIIDCFWGNPADVMEQGIKTVQREMLLDDTNLIHNFDIVIASAGGYPKDINLYQAQKAITHACFFAKKGAPIILVAECSRGSGSERFEKYIHKRNSFVEVLEDFCSQEFEIGPHKAYQLAKQGINHPIYLFSNMPEDEVRKFFIAPVGNLDNLIEELTNQSKGNPEIAVLPYATHTLPKIIEA